MDQRASAVDQDLKDILHTRMAIAHKLNELEQRVRHHAEETTMQLTQIVNRTTSRVNTFVAHATNTIDPARRIQEHPWLIVGGAVCAGYALGVLERGTRRQRNGVYPYYPAGANASPVMPDTSQKDKRTNHTGIYDYYPEPSSAHQQQGKRKDRSLWHTLSQEFGQETEETKQMLFQLGRGMIVELTRRMVPDIARSLGVTLPAVASVEHSPEAPRSPDAHTTPPARQKKGERPLS